LSTKGFSSGAGFFPGAGFFAGVVSFTALGSAVLSDGGSTFSEGSASVILQCLKLPYILFRRSRKLKLMLRIFF
jgi:hypothetical protein